MGFKMEWLLTLALLVAFLVLSSISLTSLLSREVGTIFSVEYGPKYPDMTLCSFAYNRNHGEVDISSDNSSLSHIKHLPSIKEMLRFIWVYYHEHNEDIPPYKTVWENGTIDPNVGIHDESDFMQESFVVWPGNVWHKCVTLKFPHEWNLGTQTHVSMLFNYTLIDRLMIQYHNRGQAKILSSSSNVYITTFPSYGSVYDLTMKKKKYFSNCTKNETKAEYDCTMKFIAKKMNCSIVLAEKSFYPEHYPLCETQYDFDSYIKIRKNIYNGSYEKQLQHCYERRCTEESWVARFQAPITKEHNQQILELTELNKTEKMAMLTFWMPYTEVEVSQEYIIYSLPDFIGDLGGYLGLFLGWSIQSIMMGFIFKTKEIFSKYCSNSELN